MITVGGVGQFAVLAHQPRVDETNVPGTCDTFPVINNRIVLQKMKFVGRWTRARRFGIPSRQVIYAVHVPASSRVNQIRCDVDTIHTRLRDALRRGANMF